MFTHFYYYLYFFSNETDGKIVKLELLGYQKRYTPEKHYVSKILSGESAIF